MNIRVNNLVSELSIADLQGLFGKYGQVGSVSLMSDKEAPFGTRHIAIIDMPVRDEGLSAIEALDGTKIKSIAIALTEITAQK